MLGLVFDYGVSFAYFGFVLVFMTHDAWQEQRGRDGARATRGVAIEDQSSSGAVRVQGGESSIAVANVQAQAPTDGSVHAGATPKVFLQDWRTQSLNFCIGGGTFCS